MSYQERLSGAQAPALTPFPCWWYSCVWLRCMKAGRAVLGNAGRAAGGNRRAAGNRMRGLENDVYFQVGLLTVIGYRRKTPS